MSGEGGALLDLDLRLRSGAFRLEVRGSLGETVAVLGPSGAGKTSLLEAIAGLRRAAGRVVVGGEVLQDDAAGIRLAPERRRVGYVPQDGALFPHLNVERNLRFARPRAPEDETWRWLVEILDLAPLLARYPRHLSGGEQRRVALARALLARPRLLLVDEPTAGLDARRARKALAGIRRVRRELGVPLVVVTHRTDEALALAREVIVLEEGRMLASGAARQALLDAASLEPAAGWTNRISAVVTGHRESSGVTTVRLGDDLPLEGQPTKTEITIPLHRDLEEGTEVVLAIDAGDLLLATAAPRDLSARNAWQGPLEELIPSGVTHYARVGPFLAHLTPAAIDDLSLQAGTSVWLVAKTHSWRVVAG